MKSLITARPLSARRRDSHPARHPHHHTTLAYRYIHTDNKSDTRWKCKDDTLLFSSLIKFNSYSTQSRWKSRGGQTWMEELHCKIWVYNMMGWENSHPIFTSSCQLVDSVCNQTELTLLLHNRLLWVWRGYWEVSDVQTVAHWAAIVILEKESYYEMINYTVKVMHTSGCY